MISETVTFFILPSKALAKNDSPAAIESFNDFTIFFVITKFENLFGDFPDYTSDLSSPFDIPGLLALVDSLARRALACLFTAPFPAVFRLTPERFSIFKILTVATADALAHSWDIPSTRTG